MKILYYSLIGILALIIMFISNYDIIFRNKTVDNSLISRAYRNFLFSITAFFVIDVLWGIFDGLSFNNILLIDTNLYYIVMAIGILLFTKYAVLYLGNRNIFGKVLIYMGRIFCLSVIVLTVVNFFHPVLFTVEENGVYYPHLGRYVILFSQIAMLFLVSVYVYYIAKPANDLERRRYKTIGQFGIIMLISLLIQVFYHLLPMYTIGYMLGCSLLHKFVIENEKEEYRIDLETSLKREHQQYLELKEARRLAYTDALTGAKSKLAYFEKEEQIDKSIYDGTAKDIALVVFDINNLKEVNDTLGHDAGDKYISDAFRLIKGIFKNSPVFRIGGDEFVAVLEGEDYENRSRLLELLDRTVTDNIKKPNGVVVAFGITEYIPGKDLSCNRIFERADRIMYVQKENLKSMTFAV